MRFFSTAVAVSLVIFLLPMGSRADSWAWPDTRVLTSTDGKRKLTITPYDDALPRKIVVPRRALENGTWKPETVDKPADHFAKRPHAELEARDEQGQWQTIWERDLLNDIAPVDVLLTARYLVTIDDDNSVGIGPNVIVIYDINGISVRRYALKDFLPRSYIGALPHSVSSTWWGKVGELSDNDENLILRIHPPTEESVRSDNEYIDLKLNLSSGSIVPVDRVSWERATKSAASWRNWLLGWLG